MVTMHVEHLVRFQPSPTESVQSELCLLLTGSNGLAKKAALRRRRAFYNIASDQEDSQRLPDPFPYLSE
jgi:hypothetical protein